MAMNIYVDTPFKEKQKNTLRLGTSGYELIFKDELEDKETQLAALLSADILLGNPKPVEWLQKATNLKWVQLYSTGFEYYSDVKIPAIITNMKGYYAQPCAETIIAGIMALYRGTDHFSLLKAAHTWVGYTLRENLQLLNGKSVIILGAGDISQCLAKILNGFDCNISFYARSAKAATLHTVGELKAAIPNADIIIGCLPGTQDTKGLFTAEMISSMQPHALFCNIGRGNLLADEQALVDALTKHKIGGAVLDVTADEPLTAGNPLWNCPNTILSQHSGGGNVTEYDGIASFFLGNLKLFKENKPLKNVIQLQKGY